MNKDMQKRRDLLVSAIIAHWQNLEKKSGRRLSQNELAKHFGVSPTSLSNWMNKVRDPDDENTHRLAARMGPRIYEILELPTRMPDDPLLLEVVELWYNNQITDKDRQEILDYIRKRLANKEPPLGAVAA